MAHEPTDAYGRETEAAPAKPTPLAIFLPRVEDRRAAFTRPWEPADIAHALRSAEDGDLHAQADLFEQMEEKDSALFGLMQTRRLAPASLKWSITPRNSSPEAKRAAEVCQEVIADIPNFRGALLDKFDAIGKGISVLEIDWRTDASISGIRWIHPKRYKFDWRVDQLRILPNEQTDRDNVEGVVPPAWKIIVHKTQMRSGHPTRAGALRTVVWPFLFRNFTLKDWSVFSEVFGMPVRVAQYPAGTPEHEQARLLQAIRDLGTDAAAVISKDVELQYIEATNRGVAPYEALYNAMERQFAMAIVGQDQTNIGGTANRSQTETGGSMVRQDLLEGDCEDGQESLRRDLLYPVVGFRLGWEIARRVTPFFRFAYEPQADYQGLSAVDKFLFSELRLGEYITREYVAKRYNIELCPPETPDEERLFPRGHFERNSEAAIQREQMVARQAGREDERSGAPNERRPPAERAQRRKEERGQRRRRIAASMQLSEVPTDPETAQRQVDDFVDVQVMRSMAALASLAAPLRTMVLNSDSYEELDARLRKAYDDLDPDELEELLYRAQFTARLFGRATIDIEAEDAS